MKIRFTEHRELSGGRIVKPGDTMESPADGTGELLSAYVSNGIAELTSGTPLPAPADELNDGGGYHVE